MIWLKNIPILGLKTNKKKVMEKKCRIKIDQSNSIICSRIISTKIKV